MANKLFWRSQLDKEFGEHYRTLLEKPHLFIEADRIENGLPFLTTTNLVVLFIFDKFNLKEWFELSMLKLSHTVESEPLITYRDRNIEPLSISPPPVAPDDVKSCQLPAVMITERQEVISGLTSVLRFLLKYSICKSAATVNILGDPAFSLENLLGFRGGCLSACAESSTWTRFCEIEMTQRMIRALVANVNESRATKEVEFPADLVRFEYHLAQPLSKQIIQKKIRQRLTSSCPSENQSKQPILHSKEDVLENPALNRDYAEGGEAMLSDVVLFPSVHLAIRTLGEDLVTLHLPLVADWYKRVQKFLDATSLDMELVNTAYQIPNNLNPSTPSKYLKWKVNIPDVPKTILNKSDPQVSKWKMREYTKQGDVDEAINFLHHKGIEPFEYMMDEGMEDELDWNKIPPLIHPEGGNLPESRRLRKGHQLSSLLDMIKFIYNELLKNVGKNVKIVDFCSGGGHLGILVAWSLPDAQVILVENKEESLRRAQDRIQKIGLKNIKFFQCNLTSYVGRFDIGIALHACGSATDLVLKKCEDSGAAFVVSPCCYGSIQNSQCLQYPRSIRLVNSGLSQLQYLVLAHSSDQTHVVDNAKTSQGYFCMRIIDSDRLNHFIDLGYRTWLKRMIPDSASPKNHILGGIPGNG